ncbi:FHA domain-containing protein [Coralloluteibacterium stylophorae]|uniref:FHA domain-containing protein n=1 Tax=Coralloluteibacterium stylophorae TaxID=1776034 RepID=A0A8J8AWH8_9GAMM|nr:FHA domain-containing protein [Coralloluteibacterium stylophorae]MBS7455802.1 FHA domain-containing protein [Coralloluteibacterium stylophorae]
MRLTFPNGEHPDVALAGERVTLGRAADNRVVLDMAGIAARQALIASEHGGTWLCLVGEEARAHVNARAVHRLALLRPGDTVTLAGVRMLLQGDVDTAETTAEPAPAERLAGLRHVLRGVAGPHFGRCYSLEAPRILGRGGGADIRLPDPAIGERHVAIELVGREVRLRALGAEPCLVNGQPVRTARLRVGDQVAIEQHRFVLEGPPHAPGAATLAPEALDELPLPEVVREPDPVPRRCEPVGMAWWLLLAAALLGGAITALLVYAPRFSG